MRSENQARNSPRRAAPRRAGKTVAYSKTMLELSKARLKLDVSRRVHAKRQLLRDVDISTVPYLRYASQGRRTIRSVVACSNEKNNAALDRQTAVLDRARLIVRSTPESYAPWGNDSGALNLYKGSTERDSDWAVRWHENLRP